MLTAVVEIDLRAKVDWDTDHERLDRHRIHDAGLTELPDGTAVDILVGGRQYVTLSAVRELHPHVDRLRMTIRADSGQVIRRWHHAVSTGDLELLGVVA